MNAFESLGLGPTLLRALEEAGYTQPTPIQAQAIRPVLEGRDLLGIAQTGTGKTAAFALPLLERLGQKGFGCAPGRIRVLVLTPTRELAAQVEASFRTYGRHTPLRSAVIFGGVGQNSQVAALRRGLDVLIATPGRLLDLMQQRHARLDHLEVFVLDEADRMLDMGFIRDVRRITAALPRERQTLLFSATMPEAIAGLAQELLRDPVRVEVTPPATTVERIRQRLIFVDKARKRDLLRSLLADAAIAQALVFTRTKRGADRVAEDLEAHGIPAGAIHGNKAQNHRERTLRSFRDGRTRILVATDIAARGLDIPGVSHVFNYELPDEPESYVHRIGRTARAGRDGEAVAFCCAEELEQLRDIERIIGLSLESEDHPLAAPLQRLPPKGRHGEPAPRPTQSSRPQGGHQHQGRHHRSGSADPAHARGQQRHPQTTPAAQPTRPMHPGQGRHQGQAQDQGQRPSQRHPQTGAGRGPARDERGSGGGRHDRGGDGRGDGRSRNDHGGSGGTGRRRGGNTRHGQDSGGPTRDGRSQEGPRRNPDIRDSGRRQGQRRDDWGSPVDAPRGLFGGMVDALKKTFGN